jgi:hypothetical protein
MANRVKELLKQDRPAIVVNHRSKFHVPLAYHPCRELNA